jgi:integrase
MGNIPLETFRLRMCLLERSDAPASQKAARAREIADSTIALPHPYPDGEAELYGVSRLVELFTGLRKQEALTLRWDQIDLADRTLRIPDPKNHEPLLLPLSDYLHALLSERQDEAVNAYVFPGRDDTAHLVEPKRQIAQVVQASGVPFMIHDLRRTFITITEGLDIPLFAIKRLVNHKMSGDVTAGYIVSDVERLRRRMQSITDFILDAVGEKLSAEAHTVARPLRTES